MKHGGRSPPEGTTPAAAGAGALAIAREHRSLRTARLELWTFRPSGMGPPTGRLPGRTLRSSPATLRGGRPRRRQQATDDGDGGGRVDDERPQLHGRPAHRARPLVLPEDPLQELRPRGAVGALRQLRRASRQRAPVARCRGEAKYNAERRPLAYAPGAPGRIRSASVNIFLIPYTPFRHFAVALGTAALCVVAWWLVLTLTWTWSPWSVAWDGPIFLGTLAATAGGGSLLAEGSLRRTPLWKRVLITALATALSFALAVAWYWGWAGVVGPLVFGTEGAEDLADDSLVSLRYRALSWVATGFGAGMATGAARRFRGFLAHLTGGVAAGLAGGAVWFAVGYPKFAFSQDLFYAGALGSVAFGFCFGLFTWGVPDDLYAGWLRVLTTTRHGRRIPIDATDSTPRERFVGHFPRGLDLFLPVDDGVLEMHISVLVNRKQEYRARGLTLAPTVVKRFLERVDLSYDPNRSAPLETRLSSGDRIVMGPPGNPTVVEFLMLPREER